MPVRLILKERKRRELVFTKTKNGRKVRIRPYRVDREEENGDDEP